MTTISVKVELTGEPGAYMVVFSLNDEIMSKHGPVPDIETAEALQQELAASTYKLMQLHVEAARERLAERRS